jgi:4-hydroxybenzoate polyprenyltransferase
VSGEEPVVAPDQKKPGPYKAARIAGVIVIVALLLMLIGNQKGHVEDIWLIGTAAAIAAIIVIDWVQRRNGLKK